MRNRTVCCIAALIMLLQIAPPACAEPLKGSVFPVVTLHRLDGKIIDLQGFRGNKIVLLWLTDCCESCLPGFEPLNSLQAEFEQAGLQIIAVSVIGEHYDLLDRVSAKYNLRYPITIEREGKLPLLAGTPYVKGSCPLYNLYLIDKKGAVHLCRHYPGTPPYLLKEEIKGLLQR